MTALDCRKADVCSPLHAPRLSQGIALACAILGLSLLAACTPRGLLLQSAANELAGQAQTDETDLELARDAAAFYLKLSESVLRRQPGHIALAEAVARGYTQYAYAFVSFEAERLQASDVRGALRQRQRAARLYQRAHRHAMAALQQHDKAFVASLREPAGISGARLKPELLGLAYWAAASWGAWISLSKDEPELVADLPAAMRLAQAAYEIDPDFAEGQLAVLMAQFELARPGGSRNTAERYLMRAEAASQGASASALIARAEGFAEPDNDRALYERLLRQAVVAASSRTDLTSQVQRDRALWLLETVDDRF